MIERTRYETGGLEAIADLRRIPAPQRRAVALVLHGWTGSRMGSSRSVAAALQAAGVATLAPDLLGHGDSAGDRAALSRDDQLAAAGAAYDHMAALLAPRHREPIAVVGISFGAYLAAQLVGLRKVDVLALRVPANYPDAGFERPMGELMGARNAQRRRAWLNSPGEHDQSRPLRALSDFSGRVLVQRAELDAVIPREAVERYVAASSAGRVTYQVIDDAEHAMSRSPMALAVANDQLIEWLEGQGIVG